MSDRLALLALVLVTALAVIFAPWAAVNRETGARSAVILLPDRFVDLTGRTEPVELPSQTAVLVLTLTGLVGAAAGATLRGRGRYLMWLASGALLVGVTSWGLGRFEASVDAARTGAFMAEVSGAIANPRPTMNPELLHEALAGATERSLDANIAAARAGGLVIRRLPYTNSDLGWSAFLALVTGIFALIFGLRYWPRVREVQDRLFRGVAVPAMSILLALVAAAVVILVLQPTPTGAGVDLAGGTTALIGRLDTLWYAYYTMFHDSLGTINGFAEALKFATPLIFTGLAVAFSFQAGLFNIGAPGQMVIGAIFAMLAGLYVPGPKFLVLPVAVLAAFLGGALWGALPGWLKARFGANEVINTILLNFVAASAMLFILSSGNVFAAAALRILLVIGVFAGVGALALIVPGIRRAAMKAPRLVFAVGLVVLLGASFVAGQPRQGDQPVTFTMPFKVAGNEPKSQPLNLQARLPQLPALVGIDLKATPGTNVVPIDYARLLAPLLALAAFLVLPRWRLFAALGPRLLATVAIGGLTYLLGVLVGLNRLATGIPPTNLNASFLIALLAAAAVYVFLFRTRWGYELRAVGLAPGAAEYGGASIGRNTVIAMAISGGLAGLTATHYVLGGALEDYALRQSIPTSDGFDGIAVALLAGNHPFGILLSALLFGVLKYGGSVLNITFPNLTREVVSMILALVVLFIAARGFLPQRVINPPPRTASGPAPGQAPGPAPGPAPGQMPGRATGVAGAVEPAETD